VLVGEESERQQSAPPSREPKGKEKAVESAVMALATSVAGLSVRGTGIEPPTHDLKAKTDRLVAKALQKLQKSAKPELTKQAAETLHAVSKAETMDWFYSNGWKTVNYKHFSWSALQ